jgi:hypothetical protein
MVDGKGIASLPLRISYTDAMLSDSDLDSGAEDGRVDFSFGVKELDDGGAVEGKGGVCVRSSALP